MKSKQQRKAEQSNDPAHRETTLDNRRARFEYEKMESLEAGIVLTGTEVKSIRAGNLSIQEAYARIRAGEVYLVGFTIPPYKEGSHFNHEPNRPRKLLLKREQIARLEGKVAEKGLTLVPWRLYFVRGMVKIELALARGKKLWDKRRAEQERDMARDVRRQLAEH